MIMFLENKVNNGIVLDSNFGEMEINNTLDKLNNTESTKFMNTGIYPLNFDDCKKYHEYIIKSGLHLAIKQLIYGFAYSYQHLGNLTLTINQNFRTADISIIVWDKCKGHGSQAIKMITDYAFEKMNLNRLSAGTSCKNIACIKIFEKNGFKKEAILREAYYHDGDYQDVVILRLLKSEWRGKCLTKIGRHSKKDIHNIPMY
jgi:RimJ/RimL family protein N-acetyltransferase